MTEPSGEKATVRQGVAVGGSMCTLRIDVADPTALVETSR
jgi:hypothetical protein